MNKDIRIVFMGTPEFAVPSLDILFQNGYNIVGVITVPDKPAGRGKKLKYSAVKQYSLKHNLNILQPTNLKDKGFIRQLHSLRADLQIVAAFRILPKVIWAMPEMGTFNLHASILPQYRGAAPMNWAVINGESETGVTTFFLDDNIDTGKIIFSEKTIISPDETVGELHDKLKHLGANLVLKTVKAIQKGNYTLTNQSSDNIKNKSIKTAPKLFKKDCKIKWDKNINDIYNFIRGLSPYPAAHTELIDPGGKRYYVKIFKTSKEESNHKLKVKQIITDSKNDLCIAVNRGFIHINEIQLSGKKRMNIKNFLRGFSINNDWKII